MSEIRLRKVERLLREEISIMISSGVIKDPRVDSLISITKLSVSKDLRHAKIYMSMYGDANKVKKCVEALNHAAGFIQKNLGKRLHLKTIPRLVFINDDSIEQGLRMTQKINNLFS